MLPSASCPIWPAVVIILAPGCEAVTWLQMGDGDILYGVIFVMPACDRNGEGMLKHLVDGSDSCTFKEFHKALYCSRFPMVLAPSGSSADHCHIGRTCSRVSIAEISNSAGLGTEFGSEGPTSLIEKLGDPSCEAGCHTTSAPGFLSRISVGESRYQLWRVCQDYATNVRPVEGSWSLLKRGGAPHQSH